MALHLQKKIKLLEKSVEAKDLSQETCFFNQYGILIFN